MTLPIIGPNSITNQNYGAGMQAPAVPGKVADYNAVVTPAVPAASTAFVNNTGYDVIVTMLTTGTGVSITTKDSLNTTVISALANAVGMDIVLPSTWSINLGAYTVAPTWKWQAING